MKMNNYTSQIDVDEELVSSLLPSFWSVLIVVHSLRSGSGDQDAKRSLLGVQSGQKFNRAHNWQGGARVEVAQCKSWPQ